jgi:hypothetical protein
MFLLHQRIAEVDDIIVGKAGHIVYGLMSPDKGGVSVHDGSESFLNVSSGTVYNKLLLYSDRSHEKSLN